MTRMDRKWAHDCSSAPRLTRSDIRRFPWIPRPCGYFGSDMCRCKDADVKRYQKKLSGPIVDRIDLQVELERLSTEERFALRKKMFLRATGKK